MADEEEAEANMQMTQEQNDAAQAPFNADMNATEQYEINANN